MCLLWLAFLVLALLAVSGAGLLQVFRLPVPEAIYHHAHVTKNVSSQVTKDITELAQRRAFSSYHSTDLILCVGDVIRTNVLLGSYASHQIWRGALGRVHG
jgi:hypothetical protein